MYEAARLIYYNRFELDDFVTSIHPLEDFAKAIEKSMNDTSTVKILIEIA